MNKETPVNQAISYCTLKKAAYINFCAYMCVSWLNQL